MKNKNCNEVEIFVCKLRLQEFQQAKKPGCVLLNTSVIFSVISSYFTQIRITASLLKTNIGILL